MKKLLWIDEDAAFADTMRQVLSHHFLFFRVERPKDPEGLLDYDAVIFDLTFGGREEWKFLSQLRAHPRGATLPMLAVLSRPLDLEERLRLNEYRIAHTDKWVSGWMLHQKIEALFS